MKKLIYAIVALSFSNYVMAGVSEDTGLFQDASKLSYSQIGEVVKKLKLVREDCDSAFLHSLDAKLTALQMDGKITMEQQLKYSGPIATQISNCRRKRLLHR